MTLDITYFGSGTTFGTGTKFGYTYDSETFDTDSLADVDEILLENGDMFQIEQESETTDSMGNVTEISKSWFNAYGMLQDITRKDRQIHKMGLAVPGNIKGFFKPFYNKEGTTYFGSGTTFGAGTKFGYNNGNIIKEGDILIDRDGRSWKFVQLIGQRYIQDTEIFRVFVLRNMNLRGSN